MIVCDRCRGEPTSGEEGRLSYHTYVVTCTDRTPNPQAENPYLSMLATYRLCPECAEGLRKMIVGAICIFLKAIPTDP